MAQYGRMEGRDALTDRRIDGLLVSFGTLVIGSPRKCPGNLVPSFSMLGDRFEESGILLRGPAASTEYKGRSTRRGIDCSHLSGVWDPKSEASVSDMIYYSYLQKRM